MSWRWRVCVSSSVVAAALLLERVFLSHTRIDLEPPETVDVWSFRAVERLKVHEARTDADLWSCAVRGSVKVLPREPIQWWKSRQRVA